MPARSMKYSNVVIINGKRFVRQAKLPRGAYPQKPLEEVLAKYGYGKPKHKDGKQHRNTTA